MNYIHVFDIGKHFRKPMKKIPSCIKFEKLK